MKFFYEEIRKVLGYFKEINFWLLTLKPPRGGSIYPPSFNIVRNFFLEYPLCLKLYDFYFLTFINVSVKSNFAYLVPIWRKKIFVEAMSQGGLIDPPLVVYVMEIWIFILSTFSSKTFYSYFCWKNNKIQIVINNYKQITPKNKQIFIKSKY